MAITGQAVSSLDRFLEEIRQLWGSGKDPQLPYRVRGAMEGMIAAIDPAEPWFDRLVAEALPARELYRDSEHGFILMGHVQRAGQHNQPHDHGPYWVVYGVAGGEVEITTYRRTDNASVSGRAALEPEHTVRFTRGTVRPYLPGDIHSTRTLAPTVIFRFLTGDLDRAERCRYDPEQGTVTVFTSSAAAAAG
jgi:hypothetical protein